MSFKHKKIETTATALKKRLDTAGNKASILRAPELKALASEIPLLKTAERASFGKELNQLKAELEKLVSDASDENEKLEPIDVTAPFDVNAVKPSLLPAENGSVHPLMSELKSVLDIFGRMGFVSVESRQLDDDYHMFDSLNFPGDHPARDEYDTFVTEQKDSTGKPLVAPAHASVMQNRLLKRFKPNLAQGRAISTVYYGRTFRNEDVDARHEHTFNQVELMYVGKDIHAGNLVATFKTFLEEYYEQKIEVRTQPFYFPFTEPSFELALSCPFCKKKGCNVCSQSGWIELMGMGMVHPKVLKMAGIDPSIYTGFAGGLGFDRLVMMKHGIEDVRNFNSGKLEFLRQFS